MVLFLSRLLLRSLLLRFNFNKSTLRKRNLKPAQQFANVFLTFGDKFVVVGRTNIISSEHSISLHLFGLLGFILYRIFMKTLLFSRLHLIINVLFLFCRKDSIFNLGSAETKLLYTLHWVLLDAGDECALEEVL